MIPTTVAEIERQRQASGIVGTLKLANMVNAAALIVAGFFGFLIPNLNLLEACTAFYVFCFGIMFICFEFHLGRYEAQLIKYAGFMFYWQGRLFFFFLIGTLSFGLGDIGFWVGVATLVNVGYNIYVMTTNPFYREKVKADEVANRRRASVKAGFGQEEHKPETIHFESKPAKTSAPATSSAPGNPFAASSAPAAAKSAASGGGAGTWQKLFDDETQTYYYHNESTGETRWEEP